MAKATEYVALLRGINVGGKNLIKMTALKACFEAQGFADVKTYIQSGNVLFKAGGEAAKLTRSIEKALAAAFGYAATVVVRSRKELKQIVSRAPTGFGEDPAKYRYDVLFLMAPLTAKAALAAVPAKAGVDAVTAGKDVLYYSRLVSKATQSQLSRVVGMPIYKQMTIRNWNTTSKLLQLMEAEEAA
ncbi:MAG TPA: DUF1697 domain-containing protein [Polyangia bacterium]